MDPDKNVATAQRSPDVSRRFAFKLTASAFGVSLLVGCELLRPQTPRLARIGFLSPTRVPNARLDALRDGLRELGWQEGENLTIEERYADDHADRLPALAEELV